MKTRGMTLNGTDPCPCGLPRAYLACCARWHEGPQHLQAPDSPALMRSRYSAFVLARHDYLLATWHLSTRPAVIDPDPPGLRWLGLEIKSHHLLDDDHATVEFVARHKQGGRAQRLHELSRFERLAGIWLYVDGQLR